MRRSLTVLGSTVAIVLVASLVSSAGHKRVTSPTVIHVVERATTDVVIDTGAPGDTSGDLLTWHNAIFNAANTKRVGHDQGDCIRISPKAGSWECRWTTWVAGGSIAVEGPFYDTRNNVMAITGGTGLYRNARGTMSLRSRNGGAAYDFIFRVIP